MIHLDTNFLIMSLVPGTAQDAHLRKWLAAGEAVGADAVVWTEFLCGPLTQEQLEMARIFLPHIEPFFRKTQREPPPCSMTQGDVAAVLPIA